MPAKISVPPTPPALLLRALSRSQAALTVALVLLTLAVYIPAMGGGFLWDDDWLLTENPNLSSLAGLARLWTLDWWGDKLVPDYFPVTWTSFWVEWHIWHSWAAPYHVTNILLHALSAVLLWRVLKRLGVQWAWLAGALFAVHPVNVASVAWIAERKNTLSMVFYLLTLLYYLRFDDGAGWRWYGISLGMFLLALLSKTSVVMLPVVLLLIAWWRRDKVTWRDLLKAVPFFILALTFSIVGILYQTHVVIRGSTIRPPNEGFFFRLAVAGIAPWFYMLKTLFPHPLAMVYPRWVIDPKGLLYYLPGLALVGVVVLLWRLRRWCKPVLAALVYFVVTLFPVMGFFNMYYHVYSFVADHWQYVPMIGLLALVAGGAQWLTRWVPRGVVVGAAAIVVAALGALTWQHSAVYADSVTLWRDNIAKYPDHFLPYYNLGRALDEQGRYDEALRNYSKSISLNDHFDRPYTNIGSILAKRGDVLSAAQYFDQAIRIYPNSATARANLGAVLHLMGRSEEGLHQLRLAEQVTEHSLVVQMNLATVLLDMGRINEGIVHARKAVQLDPSAYQPRVALARYLSRQGNPREAITEARAAVAINPDSVEAQTMLAVLLRATGRSAEAAEHYRTVLQIQPNNVDALNDLGVTLADVGNLQEALRCFARALELQPSNLKVATNLAFILTRMNRPAEAADLYRQVLNIQPDWPEALTSLAWLLSNTSDPAVRNPTEAISLAERACELTGYSHADMVDTLASAYAAAGKYRKAVETATRALELARASGNASHVASLTQRIEAWSAGKPAP